MIHFIGVVDGTASVNRVLRSLGVSELDEAVYRTLLRGSSGNLTELARSLGIGRKRLDASLLRLAESGLVRARRPGALPTPIDPDHSLHALVDRRRSEVDSVASLIPDLAADFRVRTSTDATNRAVEVVMGRDQVVRRTSDLGLTVESEMLALDTPPYSADLTGEVERELVRLRRGVAIKAIYSAAALEVPERLSNIRELVGYGEQARVLPSLPLKLVIFDRRTAVVPLTVTAKATASVVLVHRSGLLDALVALFDALWRSAPRLDAPAADAEGGGRLDTELLSLLASGVKDEAIARQLGVSVRTARRRITEVMAHLNATSRFQAGLEAHRRGLLR